MDALAFGGGIAPSRGPPNHGEGDCFIAYLEHSLPGNGFPSLRRGEGGVKLFGFR